MQQYGQAPSTIHITAYVGEHLNFLPKDLGDLKDPPPSSYNTCVIL
uniref:Uncharacterized protein n=1 Tax=Anguilla anguilla TaxID=7936 RepID=A0A0E9TSB7_ANGAN